jgi:hypothetical protein
MKIPPKERTKMTNSILISLMNQLEKVRACIWVSFLLLSWTKKLRWLILRFRSIHYICLWQQAKNYYFGCCVP